MSVNTKTRNKRIRLENLTKGLMFYKNFADEQNANGSPDTRGVARGSRALTHTVSRSTTTPATYFDANGVMQVTTTSNEPRFTKGYYDTTGWHSAPGWLLEGASTNYLLNSYLSIDTDADGLGDNFSSSYGTKSRIECPVNGLSGGKAQYINQTYTGLEANYTALLQNLTANDTFDASSANIPITLSFWARGKFTLTAGTTMTWVRVDEKQNDGTYRRSCIASAWTQAVSDGLSETEWRRFTFSSTVTDTLTRKLNFIIGIIENANKPSSGDTAWIQVYGVQIEKQAYPSSFIPTTTAALTRNAETTNTYTTSGNFPAPSGGNCLSFDGQNASGDDYVSIPNSATGNQLNSATAYSVEVWAFVRALGENNQGILLSKADAGITRGIIFRVGSGNTLNLRLWEGGLQSITSSTAFGFNIWNHFVFTWSSGTNPKLYLNGSECAYSSTIAVTTPDDNVADSVFLGNNPGLSGTFDGFIQCTRIYRNKALSAAEVATAYAAGRYASLPVAGCTAEYLFNEGTGTTLTDGVAGNNGTISGATWSKDTYSGTIMLKYRPIMLANEQDASYKGLWSVVNSTNNQIAGFYGANAQNQVTFPGVQSNVSNYSASYSVSAFSRYSTHTLIGTWSVTADGSGKKENLYIDGVLVATSTSFAVPGGALPAAISIQPSIGQAMILEAIAVSNEVIDAASAAEATRILGDDLYGRQY